MREVTQFSQATLGSFHHHPAGSALKGTQTVFIFTVKKLMKYDHILGTLSFDLVTSGIKLRSIGGKYPTAPTLNKMTLLANCL